MTGTEAARPSAPGARELLLQRLMAKQVDPVPTAVPRVPDGTAVPLTPAQARIWFFSRLYPSSIEYNLFDVLHLDRAPDPARLVEALRELVERHDAFRLRVFDRGGVPMQELVAPWVPEVTWSDLSDLEEGEAQRRAAASANEASREPLSLDALPEVRFRAVRMPGGRAMLVLGMHHVLADAWSWSIMVRELVALLAGEPLPPAPAERFLDYAAWLHDHVDEEQRETDLAYWAERLGGRLPVLDLPKDRPRPTVSSRRGYTVAVPVPHALRRAARRLVEREGVTLYVVMLAVYRVLLLRLSGQQDVVIGTAFAGRTLPFTETVFGCFVESVALRTPISPQLSFREVVQRVRTTLLEAQDHQSVPYEEIVARLDVRRDLAVDPVFQAQFVLQGSEGDRLPGARTDPGMVADYGAAKWDLAFAMTETPDELTGLMECSADLFDRATLDRFAALYLLLLGALVDDPGRTVDGHELVPPAERGRIVHGLNPYRRPDHGYRTLAGPFEEQVDRTPDAVALVTDDGEPLTYAELDARANAVAHALLVRGVRPGDRVALCLDRSVEMVTAVYGTAKTGATYVPLDPELPAARLEFMITDTDPAVVLTAGAAGGHLPEHTRPTLRLDEPGVLGPEVGRPSVEVPEGLVSHLLYTSGTTGRPKAVAVAADGAIADVLWMQQRYPYEPADAALFKTSYGFDVSLWEICWPLWVGARLVLCRPGGHRDVRYLAEVIERHAVSTVYLIPTQLQVFLDELAPGGCPSLRWMLSGGEAVTPRLRDHCHERLGARLVNGYGPTEAGRTTDMVVPAEPGYPVVPLGRPSTNFRVHVLDEDLRVQPIGVPGEAFIAAEVGLAHGYHRRPDMTAERFLPDPFGLPGSRMYRTGDICRYRPDGVLEHLGRAGQQVKIRGMRIELAEIESVLSEQDGVEDAVVIVVEPGTEPVLAAFVVPSAGAAPDPELLRRAAGEFLPGYMVPATVQLVDAVPATVNGKTDRAELTRIWAGHATAEESVPPADELEERLAGVFAHALGLDEVGVTDDFFDRGGHSLLVFKLIAACVEDLGIELEVADVFAGPTVRGLAARIRSAGTGERQSPVVPLATHRGRPVVVLVHAASGSVLPFRELAGHLSEFYSVHGLQTPPHEGTGRTIEELARCYTEELAEVVGTSPVCLVGWSMGGCVAVEMARLWAGGDVDVAATVLLDSWAPPALVPGAERAVEQRRAILELDIHGAEGMDDLPVAVAEQLGRVTEQNRRALAEHRPAPFDGAVELLRAREPLPISTTRPVEGEDGWHSVLPSLTVGEIPGSHFSLLRGENAHVLAGRIDEIFDRAMTYAEF